MIRPVDASIPLKGARAFRAPRGDHLHNGVDLLGLKGSPVVSVADGTVTHASRVLAPGFSGYGRIVVVRGHAGPWFLFAHLDDVDVSEGDRIQAGQRVGTVGDTCFSREDPTHRCSGAHLHFEVSPTPYPQANTAPRLDPVAYLFGGELETPTPAPQPKPTKPEPEKQPRIASGRGAASLVLVVALWGFGMLIARNT